MSSVKDLLRGDVVDGSGTANYVSKWSDADTITNSVIYDDGANVGIGTSIPVGDGTALNLYGSTASTLKLQTALSGTTITDGGEIVMYDNDLIIKNREAGYIQLATSGTERMRITSAGAIHLSQGTGNAYVGTDAGNLGTSTGSYNTAFGDISLYSNTTGNFNSANGVEALQNNTIGSFNIANGFRALLSNTTGNNNIAIGYNAGNALTTGSNNTIIGNVSGTAGMADTVIIAAGTTERMRIDSSGNLMLGTTSIVTGRPEITIGGNATGSSINLGLNGTNKVRFQLDSLENLYIEQKANAFMSFSTNDAERMRIDSSGNVGIGVSSINAPLHVKGKNQTNGTVEFTPDSAKGATASYVHYGTNGDWYIRSASTSGNVSIQDTGGNVGIGTSSPAYKLHAEVSSANVAYFNRLTTDGNILTLAVGGTNAFIFNTSSGVRNIQAPSAVDLAMWTNGSERMRITSGGEFLVGTTTADTNTVGCQLRPFGLGIFVRSGASCLQLNRLTSDGIIASFRTSDVERGSISISGATTSYNTSSDYRLKENIVPMEGALDRIDALKPTRFNFISNPEKTVDGFLAHEVQAIVPEAIVGEKDAVDEEGNPIYQGIDQSKIVPLLVGAIKELKAEIETLKSQING